MGASLPCALLSFHGRVVFLSAVEKRYNSTSVKLQRCKHVQNKRTAYDLIAPFVVSWRLI